MTGSGRIDPQVGAPSSLGAKVLYSEDLSHGQIYGSVRAENPFHDL